jgi:hypothetical protein
MCATRSSLLVALAVLLIAGAVSAGEFDHKSVSKYTDKDFKDNVSYLTGLSCICGGRAVGVAMIH